MINIRNFVGKEKFRKEKFEKVEIYNDYAMATDSYVVIKVKKQFANYENLKIEYSPRISTFINNNAPRNKFELEFDRNQRIIEEDCPCCNGSGYEHKCECGASQGTFLVDLMWNGLSDPECKKCEDTGTRASTKDEEGAYECFHCNGTGKTIKRNEEMLKVGESYIKVEMLQKLLLYVGRDIQIFADGKKQSPIFFKNDIACGLVASCICEEARYGK